MSSDQLPEKLGKERRKREHTLLDDVARRNRQAKARKAAKRARAARKGR
jgi:hypothetical protein